MNIAKHVISKCGGAAVVASWLGRRAARVYHWTYDRSRGGTGGLIPAGEQVPLLLAARADGVDLQPIDFFGMTELPPLGKSNAGKVATPTQGLNDNPREKVA